MMDTFLFTRILNPMPKNIRFLAKNKGEQIQTSVTYGHR